MHAVTCGYLPPTHRRLAVSEQLGRLATRPIYSSLAFLSFSLVFFPTDDDDDDGDDDGDADVLADVLADVPDDDWKYAK